MGVLRIKEQIEDLLEQDPYKDPYDLLHFSEPSPTPRRWGTYGKAVALGVACAFIAAAVALYGLGYEGQSLTGQPFAYFEIKAIDPDGRPVAGALVKQGAEALGVTDSFGEWRRFMRVKLGATMSFSISKKARSGTLSALKNIAVPLAMPQSGELELVGSVQLTKEGQKMPLARKPAADTGIAGVLSEPKDTGSTAVGTQAEVASAASDRDLASVWFMTGGDGAEQARLTPLVHALRGRARELGVKIDPASPFRVQVRNLALPNAGDALVQVDASYTGQGHPERLFTFLRNYQDTAMQTARDILWSAALHARTEHRVSAQDGEWLLSPSEQALWDLLEGRKVEDAAGRLYGVTKSTRHPGLLKLAISNDHGPCGAASSCRVTTAGVRRQAPVSGWQNLKLQVLGVTGDKPLIYVSGYEAVPDGSGFYEYWGQAGAAANLTIVTKGQVVYRERLQAGLGGRPVVVSLPSPPLSRR